MCALERTILGNMMAILIESSLGVRPKIGVDDRAEVNHRQLRKGEIDLAMEYTGTAMRRILKLPRERDRNRSYDKVRREYSRRWRLVWLKPFGFSDWYTLTLRRETAEKMHVKTLSDLARVVERLTLATTKDFFRSFDFLPGLSKAYGLRFKNVVVMGTGIDSEGLTFSALADGRVDVISTLSTDCRLPALDLVALQDDRGFFPAYCAAPLVRLDFLEKHPAAEPLLGRLAGRISENIMAQLNFQVEFEHREPAQIAGYFLKSV